MDKPKKRYPKHIVNKSDRLMFDDFKKFLYVLWKHLKLPPPTPIQYDIADFLQHGPRRGIIQAFRGVGKSWITAAFVLWCLWRDPQMKIMVVSANKERADAFSIFLKQLIYDVPLLRFLQPRDDQRQSNIAFDVGPAKPDQQPSVKSVGITGQLTGGRSDLIIPDDIEVPGNSATEGQREKTGELVKEFDAVLKPGGRIMYLGTPQIAQSLYSTERLQARGYIAKIWPARYTSGLDDKGQDKYNGCLAPIITEHLLENPDSLGLTTEPSRFTDIDLGEREASYGRSGFALQFMLDTALNDANRYPLKLSDLIVMDLDKVNHMGPAQAVYSGSKEYELSGLPNLGLNGDRYHEPMFISREFLKYTGSVMVIDPSGRGKDETGYAVVKILHGQLFLTAWGGLDGGYGRPTLKALAEIARANQVNNIQIEKNFGDGMFSQLFKPVLIEMEYPCTVEDFHVTGQKEARIIDTLEPVLNQHRLIVDKCLIAQDAAVDKPWFSGFYQMTHLTRDRGSIKHDDRLDALASAVQYWVEKVGMDVKKASDKHKERLMDEELQKFMKSIKGGGKKKSMLNRLLGR